MTARPRHVDPAKRREDAAQAAVTRLHTTVKQLAKRLAENEEPQAIGKAGDLLLAVAKQVADNAGLTKRHVKVEATPPGPKTIDEWLRQKASEEGEGDDDE